MSANPLSHQLKEILREKIESREWPPGTRIPSERELCEEFGVSRSTVRQAISYLEVLGLLRREQGRGTFVASPKVEQSVFTFFSFTEAMKDKGLNPRSRVVSFETASATKGLAQKLGVKPGEELYRVIRLRIADGEPYLLATTYIPISLCPGLSKEMLEKLPLYRVFVEKYSLYPAKYRDTFEPVLVDDFEAQHLQVSPGVPALLMERITYDRNDKPLEFSKGVLRGDKCRYYVEQIRNSN